MGVRRSADAALRPVVLAREVAVFRWFNDAPDVIEAPVWMLIQAGSLGSVFVTAEVVRRRRGTHDALVGPRCRQRSLDRPQAGHAGDRPGRPARYLDDVRIRGRPQRGLGYPSGHAAVATALALVTARSPRARLLSIAVAALVGGGRMYIGAHLPLDVAGGLAIGAGAALAAETIRSSTTCAP